MSDVNPLPLLQRCEAGEAGAIEEFVHTYQLACYRLALSILDDPAEAEEAAQDALVTALDRLGAYRGEAAFTTWMYTLTLNICRARLRKRRSRQRLAGILQEVFHLHAQPAHPEAEFQKIESDAALWSAIRRLADQQREAIVLRYYHDLPIANIAQVTGVSERTVHNRLHAAHERLRTLLEEKDKS
jgi:RNA polymerase sigma-70 factor (ECF subfamily)